MSKLRIVAALGPGLLAVVCAPDFVPFNLPWMTLVLVTVSGVVLRSHYDQA